MRSTTIPRAHVPGNADYANDAEQIVETIREQHKEGSTFVKIYETGPDAMVAQVSSMPRKPDLRIEPAGGRAGRRGFLGFSHALSVHRGAAQGGVDEAARLGMNVGVHDQGEPGALFAAKAGVASIDHASQLSEETMRLMKEKHIPAVPDFHDF